MKTHSVYLPPLFQEGLFFGSLKITLAQSWQEVEKALALRYQIFYEEMGAKPTLEIEKTEKDHDPLDQYCDHLIVYDTAVRENGQPKIIGTYRLTRQISAEKYGNFYTANEFDISILYHQNNILELGRSCIHPAYRKKPTLHILWRGIAAYMNYYSIKLLFGCASFSGNDIHALKMALSYLYHYHLAPISIRTKALESRYIPLNYYPKDQVDTKIFSQLPPLIKGYMRVGGFVGDGAVIDQDFNTIDVCVLVQTHLIDNKYIKLYDIKTS